MERHRAVSWAVRGHVVLSGTLLVLGGVPGVASAHDVADARFNAPIPLWLLFVGAGGTVALTALWLAVTTEVAPTERRRHLVTIPSPVGRLLRYGVQGLFFAGVVAVLVLGIAGRQVAAENVATVFTWPVWFRGVALVAIVVGSPWRALSPWAAAYRGLVWLEGRTIAVLGTYPAPLAAWPALVGFVALIGVMDNLTVIPRSPRLTAVVVAGYALTMLGGAILYGRTWFSKADPLGVLYRLFGRVAPVELTRTDTDQYTVSLRPPWQGCLTPVASVSLVVFVIATVYTVSFDGFTNTQRFQTLLFTVRDGLGTGPGTSVLVYIVGFGGFVATFAATSWLVERVGASESRDWVATMRWFAPTVIPIATAYEVAHNYPYVLRSFGLLVGVLVPGVGAFDPLRWLSVPVFWGSQVVLIVLGHVVAVVAAHFVAVERYDSVAAARRGHLPLVLLMVGYTVLSLWIISQPVVTG